MTIHRIRRPVAVAVPSAELLRLSQRSMHDRPDCQSVRVGDRLKIEPIYRPVFDKVADGAFRSALLNQYKGEQS